LASRKLITTEQVDAVKEKLVQIVNTLMGLLKGLGYEFESGTAVERDELILHSALSNSRSKRKSRK
jgi:hypothetical protein